jgi:hypothetical protein
MDAATAPKYDQTGTQTESGQLEHASPSTESVTASFIGNAVIWLNLLSAIACIVAFGRVTVPDSLYGSTQQWSPTLVVFIAAAGLNGMFFGYMLSKIGSILRRLEDIGPGN